MSARHARDAGKDTLSPHLQIQCGTRDLLLPDEVGDPGQTDEQDLAPATAAIYLVWTAQPNGSMDAMESWQAFTGQSRTEVECDGWLKAIHPEERGRVSRLWLRAVATGMPFDLECRVRRADGRYVSLLVRAVPLRSADGSVREWILTGTDVTERQAVAEAQRACELQATLEAVADAVVVFDAAGHMLYDNPAFKQFLRLHLPTARPVHIMRELGERLCLRDERGQPLPHDHWPSARTLRGETLRGADAPDLLFRTLDGRERLYSVSGGPIRGPNGQVAGGVLVLHDVTERRRLEREIAERAAQLETIFDSIADGVVVTDRQGRVMHSNRAFRILIGLEQDPTGLTLPEVEELAGFAGYSTTGQRITVDANPAAGMLQGEVQANEQSVDTIVRTRAGREIQVNTTAAPIRDATGQLFGAVLVARDVTERRRLEHQTRAALSALLAMAETLVQNPLQPEAACGDRPTAMSSAPEENEAGGTPCPASATAQRLIELAQSVLGGDRLCLVAVDETTGRCAPVAAVRPTPDEERRWWASVPRSRLEDYLEPGLLARLRAGEVVLADLTQPPAAASTVRPTDEGRTALVAPMRLREHLVGLLVLHYGDKAPAPTTEERALAGAVAKLAALVLERERLLCEREAARASALALTETNQRMDEFLGVATHELKTPVTSGSLNVELAARRLQTVLSQMPAEDRHLAAQLDGVHRLMAGAAASLERLSRAVADLLDVSRIRGGQLELRPALCDLVALVREAVADQHQIAPAREIHLRVRDAARARVVADADRIRQVVTNYLSNALKYSPEDRPVEVRVAVRRGRARVSVRDHGPGLPAEEQAHIWERYHRAQDIQANAGAGAGLGLGLYISRTIVERHQGEYGVRSAPGQGSIFWFALPLAPPD